MKNDAIKINLTISQNWTNRTVSGCSTSYKSQNSGDYLMT